jgi:hypothetical protein
MSDPRQKLYPQISKVMAWIAGVVTFIGAYIYCISEYGFLFGFGLGWFPSALLAAIVYVFMLALWPFVLVAVIYIAVKVFS